MNQWTDKHEIVVTYQGQDGTHRSVFLTPVSAINNIVG